VVGTSIIIFLNLWTQESKTVEILIKNPGVLQEAEFSLGNFTIICGGNNTGKTYATYVLFGFLQTWHNLFSIPIDYQKIGF
jgi:predicted ATPase